MRKTLFVKGAYLCLEMDLKSANISPDNMDVISARAISTEVGNISETKAIKQLFGKQAYQIPITASKSMLVICRGSWWSGSDYSSNELKGNGSSLNADPFYDLDYVPSVACQGKINDGLSNSFRFWRLS